MFGPDCLNRSTASERENRSDGSPERESLPHYVPAIAGNAGYSGWPSCYQLPWAKADVIGLLSDNVGSLSLNVGLRARIFSMIAGRKGALLSSRAVYVIKPLQLARLVNCSISALEWR